MAQAAKRSIKGFAAFTGSELVWGSIRPTKDQAEATYLAHNPQLEGCPQTYRILPIAVEIEEYSQTSFDDEL